MGDSVADYYSQSHSGTGSYTRLGHKLSYHVPLKPPVRPAYLESQDGSKANIGEKDYMRFASQARKAQKGKVHFDSSEGESDAESKRTINRKRKKEKKRKNYKRSRIDEVLGSDTY
jgi:hypothetical protein